MAYQQKSPDEQQRIYVCAIVKAFIEAGKCTIEDLPYYMEHVMAAHDKTWGAPAAPKAYQQFPSSGGGAPAAYTPQGGGGQGGGDRPLPAYDIWKDDQTKSGFKPSPINGKKWRDCSWEEIRVNASGGNEASRAYLEYLAGAELDTSDEWYGANRKRQMKAAAVLAMLPAQGVAVHAPEQAPDTAPF
jgi:hypothetical protein